MGKLLYESNILQITSYFYEEVIYYSYILLYQKCNCVILVLLSKVIILCNLLLVIELPLKFSYEHACRTLILLRKPDLYEEYTESNMLLQKVILLQLHITCEKVTWLYYFSPKK